MPQLKNEYNEPGVRGEAYLTENKGKLRKKKNRWKEGIIKSSEINQKDLFLSIPNIITD